MQKKPRRIIMLVISGFFVGLWHIYIGVSSPNVVSFLIGLICLLLVSALFMLWSWARILSLIFSTLVIGIYISLLVATIMKAFQGFAGIALFFYSPLLILSLIFIDTLNRKEIKNLYKA